MDKELQGILRAVAWDRPGLPEKEIIMHIREGHSPFWERAIKFLSYGELVYVFETSGLFWETWRRLLKETRRRAASLKGLQEKIDEYEELEKLYEFHGTLS